MRLQSPVSQSSSKVQALLLEYEQHLRTDIDLRPASIRNYLGDLRQFMAWAEARWHEGQSSAAVFSIEFVATPNLVAYRDYLQHELHCKASSINRYLLSLKQFFTWAQASQQIAYNPSQTLKFVKQMETPLRQMSDLEEAALVAAVRNHGALRDQTIIILMLHTGLRVGEVCALKRQDISLAKRSGSLRVWGKGNKYREVPLNATIRQALEEYLAALPQDQKILFRSQRTQEQLSPRGLGFIIAKYFHKAGLKGLRPHDLRHRFGYRMAEKVPLHRLAQIMGHESLDTTMGYVRGSQADLQKAVESIAWE